MRNSIATLVALAVLHVGASASAEDAALAQQYYDAGVGLYLEGKYGEAILQFRRGQAEMKNPMFPYSIALCNVRLGHWAKALVAAREAETMGGLGDQERAQNEALLGAVPVVQRGESVAADIGTAKEQAVVVVQESAADPAPAVTPTRRFGALGWAGAATAAVGGGLLIGALASELAVSGRWDDYTAAAAAGDAAQYDEQKASIEAAQSRGKIMLYSGVALTAAGAALIVVDLLSVEETSGVSVFVTPGGSFGIARTISF